MAMMQCPVCYQYVKVMPDGSLANHSFENSDGKLEKCSGGG